MARAKAKVQETLNLDAILFKCRDILRKARNSGSFFEKRDIMLTLVFLRFIGEKFEDGVVNLRNSLEKEGLNPDDPDIRAAFLDDPTFVDGTYNLPKEARWQTIINTPAPRLNVALDDALRSIAETNSQLKGCFVEGSFTSRNLAPIDIKQLVDEVNKISHKAFGEEKDLIGHVYEYFLREFAVNATKEEGEFYTPHDVVQLIASMIEPFDGTLYDPCCGSGGMFVQSMKFIEAHSGRNDNVSIFGQESNPDTWKMAKINMAIRGIEANLGAYPKDTFAKDLQAGERFDFIMANPPFNLSNWGQKNLVDDPRWGYGLPPEGNANYAWIQHMIYHLNRKGKIGLVLANGALSTQSGGEGEIRKNIIEDDLIEAIVALPTQLFYSVTIPVTLWFISKRKDQPGKTLFIDAREMGHMVDRKHRDFSEEDIAKIADTVKAFQAGTLEDEKGFSAVVTTEEIAKQDYILTPGRYVGVKEEEVDDEPYEEKMARLTAELSDLFAKSHALEKEIKEKLGEIGYEI